MHTYNLPAQPVQARSVTDDSQARPTESSSTDLVESGSGGGARPVHSSTDTIDLISEAHRLVLLRDLEPAFVTDPLGVGTASLPAVSAAPELLVDLSAMAGLVWR